MGPEVGFVGGRVNSPPGCSLITAPSRGLFRSLICSLGPGDLCLLGSSVRAPLSQLLPKAGRNEPKEGEGDLRHRTNWWARDMERDLQIIRTDLPPAS